MTYEEVIQYLFQSFPVFEKGDSDAYKPGLDRTLAISNLMGNPHKEFKSIHIAGTNGKGSSAHLIASVFQEAGYKTGLYTSPHLKDFTERIKINGLPVPKDFVVEQIKKYKEELQKINASFFEITTILAFKYFAESNVDIAIIETGLGGRLDSTNIIKPELCLITNIGLDHQQYLGNTLSEIAFEKAGIIKPQTTVVISETEPQSRLVFTHSANKNHAEIIFADTVWHIQYLKTAINSLFVSVEYHDELWCSQLEIGLGGSYQQYNIRGVLSVLNQMILQGWSLSKESIIAGIKNVVVNTQLKGRFQIIQESPIVVCDTAHNENGIKLVLEQISLLQYKKLRVVFGLMKDKNIDNILKLLPKSAIYYFCKPNNPRALNEKQLKEIAENYKLSGLAFDTVDNAFNKAKQDAGVNDIIYVGGSTFVVAEMNI